MARCVTCGRELHPERAAKYDYCMDPDCQAKNARSLKIASVGVNKASDQFVVLDERTEEEMARGRYLDPRRAPSISNVRRRRQHNQAPAPSMELRRSPEQPMESWTDSEQNLALALHVTGRKTLEEIGQRLRRRPDTVARMIVAAKRGWGRRQTG